MIPLRYNLRSLIVRAGATMSCAVGIALVVFVLNASFMLGSGITTTMAATGRSDVAVLLSPGSESEGYSVIPIEAVPLIGDDPRVYREGGAPLMTAEYLSVMTLRKANSDDQVGVLVRGMTEAGRRFRPYVRLTSGRAPSGGAREVMIGERLVGRVRGAELQQDIVLGSGFTAKVVGVFRSEGDASESEIWMDLDVLRASVKRSGTASSVRVRLRSPDAFDEFRRVNETDKRLSVKVVRETDYYSAQAEGSAAIVVALGVLIAMFFAGGATLGATVNMYGAVAARVRELGTLRTLGFPRGAILRSMMVESLLISVLGAILGVAASCALALLKVSITNEATLTETVVPFSPTMLATLLSCVAAVFMGLLGSLLPAVRASRLPLAGAMRQ